MSMPSSRQHSPVPGPAGARAQERSPGQAWAVGKTASPDAPRTGNGGDWAGYPRRAAGIASVCLANFKGNLRCIAAAFPTCIASWACRELGFSPKGRLLAPTSRQPSWSVGSDCAASSGSWKLKHDVALRTELAPARWRGAPQDAQLRGPSRQGGIRPTGQTAYGPVWLGPTGAPGRPTANPRRMDRVRER